MSVHVRERCNKLDSLRADACQTGWLVVGFHTPSLIDGERGSSFLLKRTLPAVDTSGTNERTNRSPRLLERPPWYGEPAIPETIAWPWPTDLAHRLLRVQLPFHQTAEVPAVRSLCSRCSAEHHKIFLMWHRIQGPHAVAESNSPTKRDTRIECTPPHQHQYGSQAEAESAAAGLGFSSMGSWLTLCCSRE
jgi:hypothetical protein